ncbi:MAG TPA: hypothetical protein DIS98_12050, partial [Colwellia sp.]|nr:hypothetical protein [Colwellia sp.]
SANATSINNLLFSGGDANIETLVGNLTINNAIDTNGSDGNTLNLTSANDLLVNGNICDGGTTCLASPDDNVILNLSAAADIALANTVILQSKKLSIMATFGTITLPDSGVLTSDIVTLRAKDIIDTNGRELDIIADELVYQVSAPSSDTVINTQVNQLDMIQAEYNLSINQTGNLLIADIDNDSMALVNNNGNIQLVVNNGDLTLLDTISATDGNADGVRAGLIDLQVNNGLINIGTTDNATIQSINNLDESANGGLGSEPTNQVAIRIQQLSSLDEAQNFTFGDAVDSDVIINTVGGDILIDAIGAASIDDDNLRLVVLNSDVSITATKSNGGTDGEIIIEGVNTSNIGLLVAGNNSSIFMRGSLPIITEPVPEPIPEPLPEPIPVLETPEDVQLPSESINEDQLVLANQMEVAPISSSAKKDIDDHVTAQVRKVGNSFNAVYKACASAEGNIKQKDCNNENILKSFLNSFMIGGELPTFKKGI